MQIDELSASDYDAAYALWSRIEGMGLSSADERAPIERYLARNPGISTAARSEGRLVATVLAGHDGRRGYLHHVAVEPAFRGRGVGRAVVERTIERLRAEGIRRCHLFIFVTNQSGQSFWRAVGWQERTDLKVFSRNTGPA
jgi:ribosomal protein S18 acetylase RimI-like enzyme